MEGLICPFKFDRFDTMSKACKCEQDQCSIWDSYQESCSLLGISKNLKDLVRLVEKATTVHTY
jgi:hypothetical protein